MIYNLKCNIDDKDYYEFNKYGMINNPGMKKRILLWRLYVPAIFLLMLIHDIFSGSYWLSIIFSFVLFSVVSVIWIFTIKPLMLAYIKWCIKNAKKKGNVLYSPISELCFYDDKFTEITPEMTTESKYEVISRIGVSELKAIYLYTKDMRAYIIPYSAFKSAEEQNEFMDFINGKIDLQLS